MQKLFAIQLYNHATTIRICIGCSWLVYFVKQKVILDCRQGGGVDF